ncbi:MAG: hypothetical protein AAF434_17315 [Pseudomonadota bacterium]
MSPERAEADLRLKARAHAERAEPSPIPSKHPGSIDLRGWGWSGRVNVTPWPEEVQETDQALRNIKQNNPKLFAVFVEHYISERNSNEAVEILRKHYNIKTTPRTYRDWRYKLLDNVVKELRL